MAAGDNRIRIEVQGESGDLQAALARSRQAIRGVGDESDRQTTRAGRHFDQLRAKLRRPIEAKVRVDGVGQARDELGRFVATSRQAQGSLGGLGGAVSRVNQNFSLLRNGFRLLRWPLIATGAGIAAQALSAAAAGAVGLAGALTPLSGLLAAYPTLAGAAAQGSAVWKLATGGLSEAVGGLNEKLDTSSKAFKNLSPEGQRFARTLQGLKPAIRGIQQTAQRGLFPGLREGLLDARRNLPVVERLVGRTARALGGMAARAGRALGSAEWGRDIEVVGNRNVRVLRLLGSAAGHVANALRHIAVASGPAMEGVTKDVVALTRRLEEAAERGRRSGQLGRFFEKSRTTLRQVSRAAGDVGKGLWTILKLGSTHMGGPLLGDLEKVARRFREWTQSARGQNAIRAFSGACTTRRGPGNPRRSRRDAEQGQRCPQAAGQPRAKEVQVDPGRRSAAGQGQGEGCPREAAEDPPDYSDGVGVDPLSLTP